MEFMDLQRLVATFPAYRIFPKMPHIFKILCFVHFVSSAWNAGDPGLIPGSGRSPGEGNGNPLQYSCLENPLDRGAWQATVHGVAKNRTQLSDFIFTFRAAVYTLGRFKANEIYPLSSGG